MNFIGGIKTMIKDIKEGRAVEKIKNKIKQAITPIPGEFRKQYVFWNTRQYSEEVNRTLANIAKEISPEVTAALLKKINDTYKDVTMDFVEDLVNMPKINDVAQDVIDNLKKVVKEF
jgi:hypothetical protein